MRLLSTGFLAAAACWLSVAVAQEPAAGAAAGAETHDYQSDVARMRKIVINSLYSHREIFLRELISNANDAIEKLRLTALKDKSFYDGVSPLNVTVRAIPNEDGKGGKLVITDTGIGMTPEELKTNLGTLAKSGTSEFLAKNEGKDSQLGNGNLIGAFGLGFYSSFLVADQVYVASTHAKSDKQYVFSSSSEKGAFEIYPDPRGNTLGRGTEITLILKDEALEYLDYQTLIQLITKHSIFSTTFPIFLWEKKTEEVPVDEGVTEVPEKPVTGDDDEITIEDVSDAEPKIPQTKTVEVQDWVHVNPQLPLWQRDPKNVSNTEYQLFYQSIFKDFSNPLTHVHFSGESDGVSFKSIIYIPGTLSEDFWKQEVTQAKDVRLYVKRTFITTDLGEPGLRKWASWVKAIVDAEDLPLNVSREMLQSNKFLKQLINLIMRRILQLFQKLANENKEKFEEIHNVYGNVFKLGAIEDAKNKDKLIALTRFDTNQRNMTSFDMYVANMKAGQKQIYYLAELGKPTATLNKSVFIEKLNARGYEVLLFGQALDEVLIQNMRTYKGFQFQDVAKKGLQFGDEDEDTESEKEEQKELTEKFTPLVTYLKKETSAFLSDVVVSTRLVKSPCAIVADSYGYTANIEKMMALSNNKQMNPMHEFAKKARILELNPKSPLIQGLLKRVNLLPGEGEDKDEESEAEIKEVLSILVDGALVRSGYPVIDSDLFFQRVDQVLRRSIQVSTTAETDTAVKPAPPVDPEASKVLETEQTPTGEPVHDEL